MSAASIELLIDRQNGDGGWPYLRGGSWTEPTAYAVLALLAAGETRAADRGIRWLRSVQRPDGGWPPQAGVEQSTWVTAAVALLPRDRLGRRAHEGAIDWLVRTCGEESTFVFRVREWLLGISGASRAETTAWPWVAGSAAWVGPTSIAILALEKEAVRRPSATIRGRIESGRRFLLRRACKEGGWNHGSPAALGYDLPAYPETTGMALAALRGVRSPVVERGIERAAAFLGECRSADALNWLRLGLAAHGRLPEGFAAPPGIERRTLPENSLDVLAANANGKQLFWS